MKYFVKAGAVVLCIMLLASCGGKTLTGGVWESNTTKAEFNSDGIMKITEQNAEKIYYYEDCTGEENNKYIKIYESEETLKTGEFLRFVPYYIDGDTLRMDGREFKLK